MTATRPIRGKRGSTRHVTLARRVRWQGTFGPIAWGPQNNADQCADFFIDASFVSKTKLMQSMRVHKRQKVFFRTLSVLSQHENAQKEKQVRKLQIKHYSWEYYRNVRMSQAMTLPLTKAEATMHNTA